MAIKYTFEIENSILKVVASGVDDNLQDVKDYGMATIEVANTSGCTKVLCNEFDLKYKLSVIDTFEASRFISGMAPKIDRVAIVCNPEQITDLAFFETVAVNRGLRVKGFKKMDEALEWLNK